MSLWRVIFAGGGGGAIKITMHNGLLAAVGKYYSEVTGITGGTNKTSVLLRVCWTTAFISPVIAAAG